MTPNEAIALYMGIPSLVTTDGDARVKRRASCYINRDGPLADSFTIEFPQVEITTLATGKQLIQPIGSIVVKSEELIGQTVEIGGETYPVALAFAIINQKYLDLAAPSPELSNA